MGPSELGNGTYMDVDQHPHIGLSTLTYLFKGAIHHKDSTGSDQIIEAGDVGFMSAGNGVTHTERTPEKLTDLGKTHATRIPNMGSSSSRKGRDGSHVQFYSKTALPKWQDDNLEFTLVAGNAFGRTTTARLFTTLHGGY